MLVVKGKLFLFVFILGFFPWEGQGFLDLFFLPGGIYWPSCLLGILGEGGGWFYKKRFCPSKKGAKDFFSPEKEPKFFFFGLFSANLKGIFSGFLFGF